MHELSETLLAAQRDRSAVPYVEVTLSERWGGVTQLRWERVYDGEEPDGPHAAIISPHSGALLRARTQASPDSLFLQRILSPSAVSHAAPWQHLGLTSPTGGVAITEIEGRIHVFDVAPNQRDIRERSSRDDGSTFGSPRPIATNATAALFLVAASGPGGSALILFADESGTVRSVSRSGGSWSAPAAWGHGLSTIDGIACAHIDGDWAVVVCGTLTDGSPGVWSCVRDGGSSESVGTWSTLHEVITSAAGANVTYQQPSVCAADGSRISFVEVYTGGDGYAQTFMTHTPAAARFRDHRWREPAPFGPTSGAGASLTADASHAWLTTPSGVWRARIGAKGIDISASVIYANAGETQRGGSVTLHLVEDAALAAAIGTSSGMLGHELRIGWGYDTSTGREAGTPQRYWVREVRRETRRGSPITVLEAEDAWWFMANMRVRRQLTWPAYTTSAWNILGQLLTMVGLSAIISHSSPAIVSTYPAMTISPNESLSLAVNRLMARVPDLLRFSDGALEIVHAQENDAAVYTYGGTGEHALIDTVRSSTLSRTNHVQVYGDNAFGQALNEHELEAVGNLLVQVVDRSLTTAEVAMTRAKAELRTRGVLQPVARIAAPVNAGLQLHDVVALTAPSVGWHRARLRVAGLRTRYDIRGAQAVYRQDIELGGV